MQSFVVTKSTEVVKTGRLMQMSAMFDISNLEKSEVTWEVNLPIDEFSWNVGLIVGSSGSGKTTIARSLFEDNIVTEFNWDEKRSIIDCFPKEMSIKEITSLLTSVGFGSPPNWVRPYSVLSNGEKFRATIARGLCENSDLLVIDEFTSVIDRKIAQVASHTIQKAVRRRNQQFVAVSCHYDIIDWLQPDWIYQPNNNSFERGCLRQRPSIDLEIYPISRKDWQHFKQYHYMNTNLHTAAKCFGGFIGDRCIAFASYRLFPHPKVKDIMQGHRLVVHPDYQGLGIGGKIDDFLGQYLYKQGFRYHNVVVHPAMINYYAKSPRWKLINQGSGTGYSKKIKNKSAKSSALRKKVQQFSHQRNSYSFSYVPNK